MNRRNWLKVLAGGSAGLAFAGWPRYSMESSGSSLTDSYFAITDHPQYLINEVLRLSQHPREQFEITVRKVAAVDQDLTVIRYGNLINPSCTDLLSGDFLSLATSLRRTGEPGTHMVSIEPRSADPGAVLFECDGHVIDAIDPSTTYERIVITGAHGDTVFKLSDRTLSVVSSSCRHKLCKKSASIRSGKIICAPNRLIASIGNPYAIVDGITG